MKVTDLRVALYFIAPIIALVFPWFSYESGVITIQFSIEGALASLTAAAAAVAGIYATWGKR